MTARSNRRWRFLIAVPAVLGGLLLLLLVFPWGFVASRAAGPLSGMMGRQVAIGGARRAGWFGLHPEIVLTDVRIGQPRWISAGTMATIREARVRFPVLPLLVGRFRPDAVALDGLRLTLVRDADGRSNWDGGGKGGKRRSRPSLRVLTIAHSTLSLDDRRRHVRLAGTIGADATGVRVAAGGTLRDRPLRLAATGGALAGAAGGRYPLHIVAHSPLVAVDATMRLAAPLDTAAFSARVVARGDDLTYLDDIIQAGLFPTQAFTLAGDVRHDGTAWHIAGLRARIGRSTLTAKADVTRTGDRTRLDADVEAATFDFDDFSSDAQHAAAAARKRATGDRIVPAIRLGLDGVARLDGRVHLVAHRLLGSPGSPFRSLSTTATLDRRRLVLEPLDIGLVAGHARGRLVDDDRHGAPVVDIDLRIAGATIETLLAKGGTIMGPLSGHIDLTGRGATLREAIGRSRGVVGMAVPRGSVRRDYATFAGGDIGESIGAAASGGGDRAPLRCMVARMVATDGRLTPAPLLIDTAVSRSDGRGGIDLSSERIDLSMIGAPKHPGLLRSTAPVRVYGTLAHPQLDIRPPRARNARENGLVSRLGYFLKGLKLRTAPSSDPPASDADCAALIRQALR